MSDVSSGETELLPSQSSSSDSQELNEAGHQVEDSGTSDQANPTGVEAVPGSKSVTYQGYPYAYYHGTEIKHYRCSAYRRTGCTVKFYVSRQGAVINGTHKSDCVPDMYRVPSGVPPTFENCKQQMLHATDIIRDQFYSDDNVIVQGVTKKQILGRLYRTRAKNFGRDMFGRLETEPLCDVKNSPGLKFFQFHFTYYEDDVQHRVIGWAHPQLMDRMKQRQCSIFIDATYRCVPTHFYQVVIVMMYDPISELYLPVWYALTSGKTSRIYEHLLHYIYVASKTKLEPAHVVCDFEFALIKAVQNQFPESRIVGCLFHFKQALRRKMLNLKIPEAEVNLAMREGCIDSLTVIRRCDIVFQGIPTVRRIIKRDCAFQGIAYSNDNWKKFWKYFKKTWIKKFKPEWWNFNGLNEDIINRTNNPLERYNRTVNEAFPNPHPDEVQFVTVIEEQSRENVRLISDISNRRASAPAHALSQSAPNCEYDPDLQVDSDSDLDSDDSDNDNESVRSMFPEY